MVLRLIDAIDALRHRNFSTKCLKMELKIDPNCLKRFKFESATLVKAISKSFLPNLIRSIHDMTV